VLHQPAPGVLGAHAGETLQPAPRLLLRPGHLLEAGPELPVAFVQLLHAPLEGALALVQQVELAVQRLGALHQTPLEPLGLVPPPRLLPLPGLPEADRLLLALELPGAPEVVGLLARGGEDPGGLVLRGGLLALA